MASIMRAKKRVNASIRFPAIVVFVIFVVFLLRGLSEQNAFIWKDLHVSFTSPREKISASDVKSWAPDEQHSQKEVAMPSDNVYSAELPPGDRLVLASTEKHEAERAAVPWKRDKLLREHLSYSKQTSLNFMHLHKTGGVTYKVLLYRIFEFAKKRSGELVQVRDSCYQKADSNGNKSELEVWTCDWFEVWKMPEEERNKFDVVFGHQYRVHGVDDFLNHRDVRTFTVLRDPFAKKVSFFYHFYVRARGRSSSDVSPKELKQFLLYNRVNGTLGQDVGPNYIAGRLLSDGTEGFVGDAIYRYYKAEPGHLADITKRCIDILRSYVFIGLQSQSNATLCMLRGTVQHFNNALGVANVDMNAIFRTAHRRNSGNYKVSSDVIWKTLDDEERALFKEIERIDLALYDEGVRLFKEHVKLFGCDHLVENMDNV